MEWDPWCWYIYLQNWVIYGVNVGKYSSTMDPMGYGMGKRNIFETTNQHLFGNIWNWTLDTLEKTLPQPARVQQKSSNEPVRPQKPEIGPGSVKQLRYYQRPDI